MKYRLTNIYYQLKEAEQTTSISTYKIFCDMDGVLCDFDKRFHQYAGMSPKLYESKYGTTQFWDFINKIGVKFWEEMPWMPNGKYLWTYISKYNPTLLSAPSKDASSRYGKKLWVEKNLPNTKLILSSRKNKQNYAEKNHILIDDRKDNIDEWIGKGGIGILYTSTSDTINKLKTLGI